MKTKLIPLPQASTHTAPAQQCHAFKLKIGDTIQGRLDQYDGSWDEMRLRLLFIGKSCAVWTNWTRSSEKPRWVLRGEVVNWDLSGRKWFKVVK